MPDLLDMIDDIDEEKEAEVKPDEKITAFKIDAHKKETKKINEKTKKILPKNAIKIKTDNFRTGISNITTSSKRDKPPVLKRDLIDFLESHDVIKIDNIWYWIPKGDE